MLAATIIGFCCGFFGSVPVAGPVAALVLDRGLKGRYRNGFAAALGGAIPEAAYAFLAFWGFGVILQEHPWVLPVARGTSVVLLLGLGIVFIRQSATASRLPIDEDGDPSAAGNVDAPILGKDGKPQWKRPRSWKNFVLGFSITAMNPTLIASWTTVTTFLPGLGMKSFTVVHGVVFAVSAATGIVMWFACMLWIISRLHAKFDARVVENIRKGMGVFLIAVSLWIGGSLARDYMFPAPESADRAVEAPAAPFIKRPARK